MSMQETAPSSRAVARSALWRLAEVVGGETVALIVFIALARLLAPEAFGVVALAGVVISLGQLLLQQGLGEALIQGPTIHETRFATAFWCSLGLGTLLMLIVIALAVPVGVLVGDDNLGAVLLVLPLVLPIGGAAAVIQAKLLRRMAFKVVALRVLAATTVGGIAGLGIAIAGGGVWSLVGLQITSLVVGLIVLLAADPQLPKLVFDRREARSLVRFALPVMAAHLAKLAGTKLDIAFLALFVTTRSVGYYFLAARLIFALGLATQYSVNLLALPVLSRLLADPVAFRAAAARTLWLTVATCLPAGLGLALVAEPLVVIVFGATWTPSVPPLEILASMSIFSALGLISGQILIASGKPALFLRLTIANTALFLILVALAAPHGLAAVALAGGIANALMLPAYLLVLGRCIGLKIGTLLKDQLPLWSAAVVMVLSVLTADAWLLDGAAPMARLLGIIAVGLVSYTAALWLFAGDTIRDLVVSFRAPTNAGDQRAVTSSCA